MKKKTLILILLSVLIVPSTFAQHKRDFALRKITVDYLSKGFSGFQGFETRGLTGLQGSETRGRWGKVEVQYLTQSDWVDEVSMTFYVLTASGIVLQDTILQVNVPKGRDHYAACFIHPRTLQRFGEIQRVAVGISYLEELQDFIQWPTRSHKDWWNQYSVRRGYLKKLYETPFLLNEPGKYEDTK